ncbi:FG-GAP repeat-containing protein [Nitzschia inconspicua]|uniref:FG-GAP repeat-containing protein n=1 Tax=Nitzschia inconspicua TaxID=303405 RepID=A0A9K3PTR1_9STRA|nr:FG-GAP repeat-containing protein [Nitzschia inconspicua]KAG7359440.1 FG-GAP repeat-containing protein [Nitzschia inconspicua]
MKTKSLSKEKKRKNRRNSGRRSCPSVATSSNDEIAPGAFEIGGSTEETFLSNTIAPMDPEQFPAPGLSRTMVVPEAELAPNLDEMVAMGVKKYIQHQTIQAVAISERKSPREQSKGRVFKAVIAIFFLAVIAAVTTTTVVLSKDENKNNEENEIDVPGTKNPSVKNEQTSVENTNSTPGPVAPAGWVVLGQDLYGKTWDDQYGSAVATLHDGQRIVTCARWPEFFTRVYEFDVENGLWQQLGDEFPYGASGGVAIDETGQRVAIADYTNGGIRVLDWINSSWVEKSHVGVGLTGEPWFLGISISMSLDGTRVALGDGPSEQAYIFENTEGDSWVQIGDGLSGYMFSVGLSGDGRRAIVGAENAATVYDWNDVQWVEVGQTLTDDGSQGDFGSPIAISRNGNVVAVAASRANAGAAANGLVRVYQWLENNWLQLGDDIVGESPYDEFGSAIAFSANGTRIAIGAAYADPGYVRVYEWNSEQWMKIGIEIEDSQDSYFGGAVALSDDGEVVVAGDWSYGCDGGSCGFVRTFSFQAP